MRPLFQFLCFLLLLAILTTCTKEESFSGKEVVLTFDDAPSFPENTAKMLDTLMHEVPTRNNTIGAQIGLKRMF